MVKPWLIRGLTVFGGKTMVNSWFNYVFGVKPWLIHGLTMFLVVKPWLIRGLTMFLVVKPWLIQLCALTLRSSCNSRI